MKVIFRATAKSLLGAEYEGVKRAVFVYFIVFFSLRAGEFHLEISPMILYLMVSTFSAGIMWQTLSCRDGQSSMKNLFMLPFDRKQFIFSYVSALGVYVLSTKTAGLLAVVYAVSKWGGTEIWGSVICGIHAVFVTACIYSWDGWETARMFVSLLWAGGLPAALLFLGDTPMFLFGVAGSAILSLILLSFGDGYAFYPKVSENLRRVKTAKHCLVWRYLFRYLLSHKNYLANEGILWFIAWVLPAFLGQMGKQLGNETVLPVGFAILSFHTPVCILLSGDPESERAVRFLPGSGKLFFMPYCFFIFLCNFISEMIFLCSWHSQMGSVTGRMIFLAVFFGLLSAVCSVALECFFPIRGWRTQSDLWHHPRKYAVPLLMLLLAGVLVQ